ncbi:MAG: hypothetical protein L0191_04190 [Acidobacteria bacterium]|nr:hypothetical protein [Acidobacteriota bacterium]
MISRKHWITCTLGLALLTVLSSMPSAQEPPQDRVAALKQWLGQSAAQLKQYQWVETTVVSVKGEQKSSKEEQCYYGADGKVQKVPLTAPPEEKEKRGLRGKIVENKKEEMSDSMKEAVALVKSYVPPSAQKIDACKAAGNMSMTPLPGGKSMQLTFKNYNKPGDALSVTMDTTTNRLLGISVASYMQDEKDAVTLKVTIDSLPDGTGYASQIALEDKQVEMEVNITNSGYRKTGS